MSTGQRYTSSSTSRSRALRRPHRRSPSGVDGLAWNVDAVGLSSSTATLTLRPAVDAGQGVTIAYAPPAAGLLRDAAGNATLAFSSQPANGSPAAPVPSPGSFSPSLAKPSFADDHTPAEPWVGEWGPKTDPQWVSSTGHLRRSPRACSISRTSPRRRRPRSTGTSSWGRRRRGTRSPRTAVCPSRSGLSITTCACRSQSTRTACSTAARLPASMRSSRS